MLKPDTTNMNKEEAAAALNAYYATIPLTQFKPKTAKQIEAARRAKQSRSLKPYM